MAITFTDAKNSLDEIADKTSVNAKRLDQAKSLINTALVDLTAMQTTYSALVADIDAEALANPSDAAWQNSKAEKDLLVSDFLELKSEAQSLNTLVNGA